jgi:biotin operon repressor
MSIRRTDFGETRPRTEEQITTNAIATILDRPLDPATIDTFADTALNHLTAEIERLISEYAVQSTIAQPTTRETERAALSYHGIDEDYIEMALDHIAEIAQRIRLLEARISSSTKLLGRVIVPPSPAEMLISSSSGRFIEKQTIPRLKALLLLLETHYDIDIDNECTFTAGTVNRNMFRRQSYTLVDVPDLHRAFLVCDEEGNVTYVFDSAKLHNAGYTTGSLIDLTKDQLDSLIQERECMGYRLDYSPHFTNQIASLIEQIPVSAHAPLANEQNITLLQPDKRLPPGYMGTKQLASTLEISSRTAYVAASAIEEGLTPIRLPGRNGRPAAYYSPDDQQKIIAHLQATGTLAERADNTISSVSGMARALGVSRRSIEKAIEALTAASQIEIPPNAKFGSFITPGYNAAHQSLIADWLGANSLSGKSANELAVDGEIVDLSIRMTQLELAAQCGVSRTTVARTHSLCGEQLGEVLKISNKWLYSPDQQQIIRDRLRKNDSLRTKLADIVIEDTYPV